MKRFAIYARVSTDEQAERQTIEAQLTACREWCAAKGYAVCGEYRDEGVSGVIPFEERPAGARLSADAGAGILDGVIVYRLDRLARDMPTGVLTYRRLQTLRAPVQSVSETWDDSPAGKLMFNMFMSFAEYERDVIRQRTVSGTQRAHREGRKGSGRNAFGYHWNGERKAWDVVEPQADLIGTMFKRYAAGESLETIAADLQARRIPSPEAARKHKAASQKWHRTTIHRLLTRDYYATGKLAGEFMGQSYTLEVPVIVDSDLYESVQTRLRAARHFPRRRETRALFQGLIHCGACERVYYRGTYGGKQKANYFCAGRLTERAIRDGTPTCDNPTVRMVDSDIALWRGLIAALRDPKPLAERFLHTVESEVVAMRAGIGNYGELAGLKDKRDYAVTQLTRPGVSLESVKATIAQLDGQIETLESHLEEKESEVRRFELLAAKEATLRQAVASDSRAILEVTPVMRADFDADSDTGLTEWLESGRNVRVLFADGVEAPPDFQRVPPRSRADFRKAQAVTECETTADRLLDWLGVKVSVSPDGSLRLMGNAIYAHVEADSAVAESKARAHTGSVPLLPETATR